MLIFLFINVELSTYITYTLLNSASAPFMSNAINKFKISHIILVFELNLTLSQNLVHKVMIDLPFIT